MKFMICEDEEYWVKETKLLINDWASQKELTIEYVVYVTPEDVLNALASFSDIDAIFLDISLGNDLLDGMVLAKKIRKYGHKIPIVFITIETDRLFDGYLVNALGFLPKPIDKNRLEIFLNKIYESESLLETINIHSVGSLHVLLLRDIVYIEIINHTVVYHTTQNMMLYNKNCHPILKDFDI